MRNLNHKRHHIPLAALMAFIAAFILTVSSGIYALDDDELSGYAADTLKISVGYFGGPFYEKRVFTLAELWGLGTVSEDYTLIDNMPSPVVDNATGVPLADVVGAAGIELGSVNSFHFHTNDMSGGRYRSLSKHWLLDTPRFCFYSLPDNFDYDSGTVNPYAGGDYKWVPTIISLEDNWNRTVSGHYTWGDYTTKNTNTRFRLLFGQSEPSERRAESSAKWINEIQVELAGSPTITLDESVLEMEVGSSRRVNVSLRAGDPVIEQNAVVLWSSSDSAVAEVDSNGEISLKVEGSAVITASYGGVSAAITVRSGEGDEPREEATVGGEGGSGGEDAGGGASAPEISEQGDYGGGGQVYAPPDGLQVSSTSQPEAVAPPETQREALSEPVPGGNALAVEIAPYDSGGGALRKRVYEMSETAVELPVLEIDNPLLDVTAVLAVCLIICGGAAQIIRQTV